MIVSFRAGLLAFVVVIFLATSSLSSASDGLARLDLPRSWQQDAELTDLFFLNQNLGWAVGAQGVILRTVDGGKSWSMISTEPKIQSEELNLAQKLRNLKPIVEADRLKPVRCRFETVHFVDAKNGWVAGGFEYPCVDRSRAVVLKTSDGGQTWDSVNGLVLPRIAKIRFENQLDGWAIGDASNLYQTGLFFTSDGGFTWSSHSTGRLKNWVDGQRTSEGFVLLDESGQLYKVSESGAEKAIILDSPSARITTLKMLDDHRGLAAGFDGLILKTDDGGLSWKRPPQFAQPWLADVDFRKLTQSGKKFWLIGDPGSVVVSIDQQTGQLEKENLPITTPLSGIAFADENNGCLAGALGSIVFTNDGGQSWQRVQGTGRVALLSVFPTLADVPFEIIAKYSSEEDFISANVFLNRSSRTGIGKLRQATERIGSSQSFEFEVKSSLGGRQAQQKLVRTIRALQPNVVVTQGGFASESLVQSAIAAASDSMKFPDQLKELGLTTWQVDRLAVEDDQGNLSLDRGQLLPRAGSLIEDLVAVSRGLVGLDIRPRPRSSYRLIGLSNGSQGQQADLFEGLNQFGKETPKRAAGSGRGDIATIQHTARKQKAMHELLAIEIRNPQDALRWRRKIQSWIGLSQEETAGVWTMQLAQQYLEAGKPELAAQTIELLANHWPNHALAPTAMSWLIRYYASTEFSRLAYEDVRRFKAQTEKSNQSSMGAQPRVVRVGGVTKTVWLPDEDLLNPKDDASEDGAIDGEPAENVAHEAEESIEIQDFLRARRQNASLFLTRLRQRDPDLALGPDYRFIESQLTSHQNGWLPAANLMRQLSRDVIDHPAMALAAKREIQLQENENLLPNRTLKSNPASSRPYLDGRDEDQVWQAAAERGHILSNQVAARDGMRSDTVMFAHDEEFLFVIANCHKIKGQAYDMKSASKKHDADLTKQDRIEVRIDVDRDYGSAMRFTIDHRGLISDGCSGCTGWNPNWYVAHHESKDVWSIEAAIPLAQLSLGPVEGAVWGVSLRRRSYDSSDLWPDALLQPISRQTFESATGIQAGLKSEPNLFWLLKFE